MSNTSVSRCTISAEENTDSLYVKVKNNNQQLSRQISISAYSKNPETKELLTVYVDDQPTQIDTLEPESEQVYRIDVSNVKGPVIFEITQKVGGSGVKISKNSKNPTLVELNIK